MHTHSWPSHSSARVSSGCRSDDHPGRKVSPVLWIPPSASPSASRTASHSCIAPLRKKTHKHWASVEHTALRHKGNRCVALLFSPQEEVRQSVTASHISDQASSRRGSESKPQQKCYCSDTQRRLSLSHRLLPWEGIKRELSQRARGTELCVSLIRASQETSKAEEAVLRQVGI